MGQVLLVCWPMNGPGSICFWTTEWSRFYWFKDYVNIVQSICMYSIVLRSTPIIEFALIFLKYVGRMLVYCLYNHPDISLGFNVGCVPSFKVWSFLFIRDFPILVSGWKLNTTAIYQTILVVLRNLNAGIYIWKLLYRLWISTSPFLDW